MVIKSRIRGGGRALAAYLLTRGQNEEVRILDVDGMGQFSERDFRHLLGDFSLNEELTKSRQGLYHVTINPAAEEIMQDDDWLRASDILMEELGYAGQRRALVLHRKHGRTHCHLAIERYSHSQGKMLGIAFNFHKQDKARARMEQAFGQRPTARRNPKRAAMKEQLTAIWKGTGDAKSFIRDARGQGYQISMGYGRIPYMVIDGNRSFSLVRQLEGIKTKEVRERLKDTALLSERDAIAFARTQQSITGDQTIRTGGQDAQQQQAEVFNLNKIQEPGKEKTAREAFAESLSELRAKQQKQRQRGLRPR